MRLARNLFLLAATAIATLAFASTANAVEVTAENTVDHCPEVETNGGHTVTGGCLITAATEPGTTANLALHGATGETVISLCENAFDARIHETGDGFIYNQQLSGANCFRVPCDESATAANPHANIPWPLNLTEFNPGVEQLAVTFCVRQPTAPDVEGGSTAGPTTSNTPCTIAIPIVNDGDHAYEFRSTAVNRCSQAATVSLTGHWALTSGAIEVAH